MEFVLALFLSAATGAPPSKAVVQAQAQASIVILRPHKASAESWEPGARRDQRETVKKEKDGSEIRLRLTEFE